MDSSAFTHFCIVREKKIVESYIVFNDISFSSLSFFTCMFIPLRYSLLTKGCRKPDDNVFSLSIFSWKLWSYEKRTYFKSNVFSLLTGFEIESIKIFQVDSDKNIYHKFVDGLCVKFFLICWWPFDIPCSFKCH